MCNLNKVNFTKPAAVNLLASACTSQKQIGLEFESFAFDARTLAPLPYAASASGASASIKSILEALAQAGGWRLILEDGEPIGATEKLDIENPKKASPTTKAESKPHNIALEPGGQLEIALAPQNSLGQVATELHRCLAQLKKVATSQGANLLHWGFAPWQRSQMAVVPKKRYKIMRRIMPKVGSLGLDMMHRTSSVQVSLDYQSPQDMVLKFRTALLLQPFIVGWFANSVCLDGTPPAKFLSYRTHCWANTDARRAWFIQQVFNKSFGFGEYVDFALKVPMYFIRRNNQYIDLKGELTFSQYAAQPLEVGGNKFQATLEDFEDHLSTIFTQARLKSYLEIRGCDGGSPEVALTLAKILVGLLYDPTSLAKAYELLRGLMDPADLPELTQRVAVSGLATEMANSKTLKDNSVALWQLAAEGLARSGGGKGEGSNTGNATSLANEPYLSNLLRTGLTPAQTLLKRLESVNNSWQSLIQSK